MDSKLALLSSRVSLALLAATHLSVIPVAQAEAQAMLQDASSAALTEIDALVDEYSQVDRELEATRLTEKQIAKSLRIERRLKKRLPRVKRKIEAGVARMSDAAVEAELVTIRRDVNPAENPQAAALLEGAASDRAKLAGLRYMAHVKVIPQASRDIAKAGGMVPYLFQLKKQITHQKQMASEGRKLDRTPAANSCTMWWLAVGLLVVVFFAMVIISSGLAAIGGGEIVAAFIFGTIGAIIASGQCRDWAS